MLERIRLALRTNTTLLDGEINETIEEARAEMIRLGIKKEVAEKEDDALINKAIKTYALSQLADEKYKEKYDESWKYQLDCLSKSKNYRGETDV